MTTGQDFFAAMYSRPDGSDGRESRRWWAIDEDENRVVETLGWSCAPNEPTSWWCPDMGYTMTEGYHLFRTREEAIAKLKAKLEAALVALDQGGR